MLNIDIELDVVFDFIVLGVGATFIAGASLVSLFVVTQVCGSQDTTLTEIPVNQLFAEVIVNRVIERCSRLSVHRFSNETIAAHFHRTRNSSSVIRARLNARHEGHLLAGESFSAEVHALFHTFAGGGGLSSQDREHEFILGVDTLPNTFESD